MRSYLLLWCLLWCYYLLLIYLLWICDGVQWAGDDEEADAEEEVLVLMRRTHDETGGDDCYNDNDDEEDNTEVLWCVLWGNDCDSETDTLLRCVCCTGVCAITFCGKVSLWCSCKVVVVVVVLHMGEDANEEEVLIMLLLLLLLWWVIWRIGVEFSETIEDRACDGGGGWINECTAISWSSKASTRLTLFTDGGDDYKVLLLIVLSLFCELN